MLSAPAEESHALPHLLVHSRSPFAVYVKCRDFIEALLRKHAKECVGELKNNHNLAESRTFRLIALAPDRRPDAGSEPYAHLDGSLWRCDAWIDAVRKMIATRAETSTAADGGDRSAAAAAAAPVAAAVGNEDGQQQQPALAPAGSPSFQVPPGPHAPAYRTIDAEVIARDYIEITPGVLLSLLAFVKTAKEWWRIEAVLNARLPQPCQHVGEALGLPASMVEDMKSYGNDNFTVGRLLRALNGTFLVSAGPHSQRCESMLVRLDSPLMRNVVLVKWVDEGRRAVHVVAIHTVEGNASAPLSAPGGGVHYVELSGAYVRDAFDRLVPVMQLVKAESNDDVL